MDDDPEPGPTIEAVQAIHYIAFGEFIDAAAYICAAVGHSDEWGGSDLHELLSWLAHRVDGERLPWRGGARAPRSKSCRKRTVALTSKRKCGERALLADLRAHIAEMQKRSRYLAKAEQLFLSACIDKDSPLELKGSPILPGNDQSLDTGHLDAVGASEVKDPYVDLAGNALASSNGVRQFDNLRVVTDAVRRLWPRPLAVEKPCAQSAISHGTLPLSRQKKTRNRTRPYLSELTERVKAYDIKHGKEAARKLPDKKRDVLFEGISGCPTARSGRDSAIDAAYLEIQKGSAASA
jgi:hypothetical protein